MDGAIHTVQQFNGAATGNPIREYNVGYAWDADPWDGITIPAGSLEPYEPRKVALRPVSILTKF